MLAVEKYIPELKRLTQALSQAKRILITAPGAADGDSVGAQLALKYMIETKYPEAKVFIINDEPIPHRYQFMMGIESLQTPESAGLRGDDNFDLGILVDGGIDRAGRLVPYFERCTTTAFIDHHLISFEYPYTIRIVEPKASATTQLIYELAQTEYFLTPMSRGFAQAIFLGLIFDTGFFRHPNTSPSVLELGAKLLRSGFDFTEVGERGLLERTYNSLKLLSSTLAKADLRSEGKLIWASLTQSMLKDHKAVDDDREGIIDHMLLTTGVEVAMMFYELPSGQTRISFRSRSHFDVAAFARSLTEHGGGHDRAAGALINDPIETVVPATLAKLEKELAAFAKR